MIYENISIMCVEDDELTAKIMSEILKQKFKEVHIAYNGYEAIEIYKLEKPDIILTDIMMPKLNGIELIKKIRKIDNNQIIAILTAYNEKEYIDKAKELGVVDFLHKPIEKKLFFDSLDLLVKKLK